MEIIFIIILLMLIGLLFYLAFSVIKWILKSKVRIIKSLFLVGIICISIVVNKVFFQKMEFIQSKIYPNLYLIKYPIKNRDSINKLIKSKTNEVVSKQPFYTGTTIKLIDKNTIETISENDNTIHFYLYTNEWGFSNGTQYFIEHKEDPGGFTTEVLTDYKVHKMAYFELKYCKNDSAKIVGNLTYFKEGKVLKTEQIINHCKS